MILLSKLLLLEKHCIAPTEWPKDYSRMPKPLKKLVDSRPKISTAIGYDSYIGWFALQTQGQGPVLIYHELPLPATWIA